MHLIPTAPRPRRSERRLRVTAVRRALARRGFAILVSAAACACGSSSNGSLKRAPDEAPDVSGTCDDYCAHSRAIGCGDPLVGCEGDCTNFLTMSIPSECEDEGTDVYTCQVEQPASDYACSQAGTPVYRGAGCSVETDIAGACIDANLPTATPACLRYCDLAVAVCPGENVAGCRQSCRYVALVPECLDEHEAHRACIAGFEAPGLLCVAGDVEAANSSCADEATAFEACLAGD